MADVIRLTGVWTIGQQQRDITLIGEMNHEGFVEVTNNGPGDVTIGATLLNQNSSILLRMATNTPIVMQGGEAAPASGTWAVTVLLL